MSRWFRHYAGMMRDEKLVRVAVRSKQTIERVVWIWGAILESAAEMNDAGRYEIDTGEAAYFLRCDENDLVCIVQCLHDLGRLSGGVVVRWDDRQFNSDSAKERQRRYRERRKAGGDVQELHDDVGEASPSVTRDVTPPSRDGEVTAQEAETDTELSVASATDAASASRPVDWRDRLWTEGPPLVSRLTGKTNGAARSLIGRWLRDAADDCRHVLGKIIQAEAEGVGDPVPWITAAVKAQAPPPSRMDALLSDLKSGKLDVPDLLNGKSHEPAHATIDASYERTDRGGSGHLVQVHALPSGR